MRTKPNLETASRGHTVTCHTQSQVTWSLVTCHMATGHMSHSHMSHRSHVTDHMSHGHRSHSYMVTCHIVTGNMVTWSSLTPEALQDSAFVNRRKGYLEAFMKSRCLSHPFPALSFQLLPPNSYIFRDVSGQVVGSPAGGQVLGRLEESPLRLHLCFMLCLWTHNRERHRVAGCPRSRVGR